MDPINLQPIQKAQKEEEEMLRKFKADRDDWDLEIEQDRAKSNIRRDKVLQETKQILTGQCSYMDERFHVDHVDYVDRVEKSLVEMVRQGFEGLRVAFAEKRVNERDAVNKALTKLHKDNEQIIKSERQKLDSIHMQVMRQMEELETEHSKVKSLIEFMIHQENGRARMNVEVPNGIYMPRRKFLILMDNECGPDELMRFKVHMVKQLYSDLRKYDDERDDIGQVTICKSENKTIEYHKLVEVLYPFGYTGDAELYYLLPIPGIEVAAGLVKINGEEEVKLMVNAHAKAGTKICHLYLVNRSDFTENF